MTFHDFVGQFYNENEYRNLHIHLTFIVNQFFFSKFRNQNALEMPAAWPIGDLSPIRIFKQESYAVDAPACTTVG